jgi:hypothetical protein
MKTITPTLTPTTFFLPADDLRAAFQCVGTEQTRYYLGGVFVEADNLVALDGNQMLTIELPDGCHVGTECFTQGMDAPRMPGATGTPEGAGFILSCDATDKAFKSNSKVGDLWVYGDIETGILQFVINHGEGGEMCRTGVLEFTVIDGTYPYWRRVVAKGDGSATSLCYNPTVLAKLIKAADVIEKGRPIRLTGGEGEGDPIRVDFVASPRLRGTLMQMRWTGA